MLEIWRNCQILNRSMIAHLSLINFCHDITPVDYTSPMTFAIHHGLLPGFIGRITELHGAYYSARHGFGVFFEARVARDLSEFCLRYDETHDGLWLALLEGRIEGAIVIDGIHAADEGAHLRWFIVSDRLRGQGAGSQLLASAIGFARECGYSRIHLSTFEGLLAARHLYEKAGFRLVHQQPGSQWGSLVNEQVFELVF